jgi:thiaminase
MTSLSAARAAGRLTTSLPAVHTGLRAALREHPAVAALADGSLPDEEFTRLARQRRRLAGPLRQALLTLRSCNPPTSLDHWLAVLLDETAGEAQLLLRALEALGSPVRDDPQPACLGYGSYVRCCAADGLVEGLTAVYAMQRSCLETWGALKPAAPPGTPRHDWERHWTGKEHAHLVAGLGRSLDQMAREAGPWQRQHLESIFGTVLRWEYLLWTACTHDDRWPA